MQANTPKPTMICDWAYVFDTLSIWHVKANKLGGFSSEIYEFTAHIITQIGAPKYLKIIESDEYKNLFQANLDLFDGVEKVRHGSGMDVKQFDDLNQARHRAKQVLQKRFWGNELTEVKT